MPKSHNKPEDSDTIRIQKFIADNGICSRRKAEELINECRVTVDGKQAVIGQKILPNKNKVCVDSKTVGRKSVKKVTLLMNKPRGALCSNNDPNYAETIFSLLPKEYQQKRLFCAGRLDKDSEGMLILTNDGTLANLLTHPTGNIIKKYITTSGDLVTFIYLLAIHISQIFAWIFYSYPWCIWIVAWIWLMFIFFQVI